MQILYSVYIWEIVKDYSIMKAQKLEYDSVYLEFFVVKMRQSAIFNNESGGENKKYSEELES